MVLEDFKSGVATIVVVLMVLGALVLGLDSLSTSIQEDISATATSNTSIGGMTNNTIKYISNFQTAGCIRGTVSCTGLRAVVNATEVNGTTILPTSDSVSYACSEDGANAGNITIVTKSTRWNLTQPVYLDWSCKVKNDQYNITQEGLKGSENLSGQIGTIGTILGVAALVVITMAAFMYVRK